MGRRFCHELYDAKFRRGIREENASLTFVCAFFLVLVLVLLLVLETLRKTEDENENEEEEERNTAAGQCVYATTRIESPTRTVPDLSTWASTPWRLSNMRSRKPWQMASMRAQGSRGLWK